MPKEFQKFHISQKGLIMRGNKCLIIKLRIFDGVTDPDTWDLPGGRMDVGEEAETAFKREMEEETGIKNFKDLSLVDYFIKPTNVAHPFCGFVRLLEIGDGDEIKLSFEHCDMRWIGEDEVDNCQYCWPKMPEMIKRGFELYKKMR
jgi:8-oxo-dGTP diphosphatase